MGLAGLEPATTSARAFDGVEVPVTRNAFQLMLSTVLELQARARDEIPDCARHEHLSGRRLIGDPRADVNVAALA
jgi:hypothetical protein